MSDATGSADFRTLIARGDDYARNGDARAAVSFYQLALASARQSRSVDAHGMQQLQRAQAYVQARAQDFQQSLSRAIDGIEPAGTHAKARLRHSLDMLNGTREIFAQQPSVFYYPYLAQRQFFEREEFEWAEALEAETPAIKAELVELLRQGAQFRPYIEAEKDRPGRDFHGLLDDPSWSAFYLWKDGKVVEENAARCPRTMAALEKVPLSNVGSRTPSVLFSLLTPGAHIPPHHGMLNSRLICHLPLIVPPGCWLRVGNETRNWEEGRLLIFDDSIQHEARNPSAETRVILLFDVWRPELGDDERRGISAIFDAIDRFAPLPDA
ncbi:MAG TPA: aspartyl/asparaginyl beta-hydroxylase domain-containing protein [Sphingomicrobium sp.]|nr:aspartyl/asparaginyl beta-hydroxylase domain-containing protein [Sphingomicrobium sp.]